MKSTMIGMTAAALLAAAPVLAQDVTPQGDRKQDRVRDPDAARPHVPQQDRTREQDATRAHVHEALHDALMEHAGMPETRPAMPSRDVARAASEHGALVREAAATRAAHRHAAQHGAASGTTGTPGAAGPGARHGTMSGGDGAGAGDCGEAAGMTRTMEMHRGTMGGDGTGTGDGSGTGGEMTPGGGMGPGGSTR